MSNREQIIKAIGKATSGQNPNDCLEALLLVAGVGYARAHGLPGDPELFVRLANAARDAMDKIHQGN